MLQHQINLSVQSILERLKNGTRENHHQIEKIPVMKRMFADDYSIHEYTTFLKLIYGFYVGIEPVLFWQLSQDLRTNFESRSKIAMLRMDLKTLGLDESKIDTLPVWQCKNYINNLSECLGAWYVLEGSTLGGQVIFQQLGRQFGCSAGEFTHFHQGYRSETRRYWQELCEVLNQNIPVNDIQSTHQAVTAAKFTFNYLSDWLSTPIDNTKLSK